eukprot:TRINITY_DN9291_c0_g1_i1.p1 TRINITY_DN9291_c0_g1~~TRINITY_DN9291_c0_g1_i1.p1  ORF type:complete len:407 (-),score=87.37 TRINITY_DN9291_c0_g1_i1:81-1301(-)
MEYGKIMSPPLLPEEWLYPSNGNVYFDSISAPEDAVNWREMDDEIKQNENNAEDSPSTLLNRQQLYKRDSSGDEAVGSEDDKTRHERKTKRAKTDWMDRFEDLKKFWEKEGHCNLSYLEHSELYGWLHRQKHLSRKGELTRERQDLLSSIGIIFELHWDEMFAQFKTFKDSNEEWSVSIEDDPKLKYWLWMQSCSWKSGKLSEERVKKLEDVGLSLVDSSIKFRYPKKKHIVAEETPLEDHPDDSCLEKKSDRNWMKQYDRLKAYKSEHGTIVVPMKSDKQLSLWIRTQKKSWKEGKLADWKVKYLMDVGFYFPNRSNSDGLNDDLSALRLIWPLCDFDLGPIGDEGINFQMHTSPSDEGRDPSKETTKFVNFDEVASYLIPPAPSIPHIFPQILYPPGWHQNKSI